MPLSTFMGLETTLRGILAQQLAINVTGHNIANANTVGYTRQTALLAPTDAYSEPGVSRPPQAGQLGTGVDVTSYTRMRDGFLDIQYRAQAMKQGLASATKDGLTQVQDALAEPSDHGLNSLLQQYWSSWQDVSNAPENLATRQSLAQNAASLADGFNALGSQLSTIQSQTGQNVLSTIDQVNSIGGRIAQLNDAIMKDTVTGDHPNDLLDQRDLLIDQLSQLGNISVTATTYGQVDVSIGGASLVSGATASTLAESNMTSLTSGKLAGLITLRDTTIPGYQSQLDTVASTLITATNAQHALGYDLNGNAGGTFFTGTSASTIAIDPALISNPALIAASGNGNVGNADNALSLANIRNQALVGASTIDTAYSQLVTQIGSDTQQAQRDTDTANLLTGSIDDRRQSVSGVSLDEEMTNLVKFQRGYQASARAMSAMDEMIDQLISRTGKVGL